MKILKNKKLVSILIDFSFVLLFFSFFYYLFVKIKAYGLLLQEVGFDLTNIENVIADNIDLLNSQLLMNNLKVVSELSQKISFLFFVLLVGCFLLYCLFQSIQWSYILNNLKNYKRYVWKFILVSLVSFSLTLYILWHILIKVRPIFLNYFSGISSSSFILKLIILVILLLILWFYTFICYVYLGKGKFIDSLKKTLSFFDKKVIFNYILSVIAVVFVLIIFNQFNLVGLFWWIIELLWILLIVNRYRYYLVKILY